MKKRFLVIAFLLSLQGCIPVSAENITEPATEFDVEGETEKAGQDFKEFDWGMTKDMIVSVEGAADSTGEVTGVDAEYLVYERTLCGMDAVLAYYFCDDGFYEARYIMNEKHSVDSKYIDDYAEIRTA